MRLTPEAAGEMLAANVAATMKFERTPANVVMRAVANIQRSYPELMSTLDEADWANKTSSFCRLNVPEEHARAVTTDVFAAEGWIETSLLHLLDTGVIVPVVTTAESTADMKRLRKSVAFHGLMPEEEVADEPATAAPEPSGPTEEQLDAQIITDWRTLCTSDIKSKCFTDSAYRARFDRLMSEGRLGR